MSRLSNLLREVKKSDEDLAADIEREFAALSDRRAFGLNFERHVPESVELPGRPIRRGDKVRLLASRDDPKAIVDDGLWRVAKVTGAGASRKAELVRKLATEGDPERTSTAVDDLVAVAEFRDPIFPGLVSTGKVENGNDSPYHSVINAENFHALEALLFTHEGKVDAIYIDPPYNTGAKDWKYNNDYVDGEDQYRHSKWLAFMERRLRLARRLLNPNNSVLIITIDEKELHRLGLLVEQTFPGARSMLVTSVINPRGKYRANEFARSEEYIFFVAFGSAVVQGEPDADHSGGASVPWRTLRRSDLSSARGTSKGGTAQFYPIYVNESGAIEHIGEALAHDVPRSDAPDRPNCTTVFPIRDNGTEMNWGLTGESLRRLHEAGYVRVGRSTPTKPQTFEISYLTSGRIADIRDGRASVVGKGPDGSVIAQYITHKLKMPVSTWVRPAHNAERFGTDLLKSLLGEKVFPYPKSLYAVEDALRLFVGDNHEALIVDFFAGSGTTAHAVMRLNKQDGGRRRSVVVTNNEVSADEQAILRKRGLRPGDAEWESHGICEYITKPRLEAAVTGRTPEGEPIDGDYKFVDEFPISDGIEANVEFFTMTYEAPRSVAHHKSFEKIAPLLWLRAGAEGRRIEAVTDGFDVADTYGVLFDLDSARGFLTELSESPRAHVAFIVTDDDRAFQAVCAGLPSNIEAVRLYSSYLTNFQLTARAE